MLKQIKEKLFAIALSVCIVTALTGCGEEPQQRRMTPEVRYTELRGETVTLTMELPGRIAAFTVSEVRPQVSGIIQSRLFEEGTDVKAGQVLYQIDPAPYQASYNNAKANLVKAEANAVALRLLFERYNKLVNIGVISKQDYDDSKAAHERAAAEIEAAKEAVESARINLGYTKITAPVSGRIGRSFVTPGALVTAHQANMLASIQQLSPVYVDLTQSNTEILKLRRDFASGRLRSSGQESAKVKLKLEDGSPYVRNIAHLGSKENADWIEGDLLFSDVTIDQSTGMVTIRAKFDNPDSVLLPGMYVRAILEEGVRENSILLPQKTRMRDPRGNDYVYVLTKENPNPTKEENPQQLKENEFYIAKRDVVIDREYQNHWLVTSGVKVGEPVLVDGHLKVRPGQIVTATKVDPDSAEDTEGPKTEQGSQSGEGR